MKYLLLIYTNEEVWDELSEEERRAVNTEGAQRWQDLVAAGEMIMGEPLGRARDARIVRVRGGSPLVVDGPFAETKEQIAGFLLLDVANEARAVEIAASWPDARYFTLEVRSIDFQNATENP